MIDKTAEQIWIPIKQAAEITGYTPAYLTDLVKEMLLQPEDERPMQVRYQSDVYEIWLPDLIEYVAQYAAGRLNQEAEEIWVNSTEAAEITGYNPDYLRKIVRLNREMPEDQRLLKLRKRSHGYDMWLPDLIKYIKNGHGPYQKPRRK
jgi:hypothetical protein